MNLSANRPRTVTTLLLWLAAVILGGVVISRSTFTADLSAFLPAAPDAQQRMLIEQLHSGTPARTLMIAIEGGTPEQRAAGSRALAEQLRKSAQFEQVLNGDRNAFAALGEWVFAHRYLLSPNVDPKRFSATGLSEAIDDTLSLLGTPAGSAIKPLLYRDPTGETQRIAEQSLGSGGPATFDGLWVSRDRQRALLLTTSKAAGADLDAQAASIATVKQAFATLATPGLRLQYTGAPKFAVDSRSQIQAEVEFLAIAGTLLMGGVLLLAFGSVAALAVAMLPVLTGVVAGVAAVSLGFGTVHGITLGFGTTLIGEAVDYAIYYLIQVRGGPTDAAGATAQPAGWRAWLVHGWPTVRLGLLTSVCGFAALAFSAFPGLAQLGVFSIAGLVAAALTTRFVLPMLMPDGARGRGLRRLLGRWALQLVAVLPRWRGLLSALGLASAALLMWNHDRLWRAELSSLSPVPSAALALDTSLRAELSQNDGGSLVAVQADSAQAVLHAAEVIGQRLDHLVAQGRIGGYESVTRLLPSLATQKARQAALPETQALQTALAQATKDGPLPAAKLTPFIADMEAARQLPLVTPEAIAGTPLGPLVGNLLMRRADGQWLALMPLQAAGSTLDEAAVKGALQGITGAQWLDISGELGRLYRRYLGEAQTQALLGVAGVVLLIALWLRSGRRLLAVCQPLLLSVLLTMAGLTALQVPLGILHMVGLLLVVAVGSNYALFFDLLRSGDRVDEDTMASLLLANLTTVLSFGLIAFSAIPSLSAIGRVVAPGAALALLMSAAYAPRQAAARA